MRPADSTLDRVKTLFVDRTDEVNYFQTDLWPGASQRPVYYITGEIEIGKSWLLHRFYLECATRSDVQAVMIDFSYGQGQFTDYRGILNDIKASLDDQAIFYRYLNSIAGALHLPVKVETGAGDASKAVEIADGAQAQNVKLDGQYAGRDIINIYLQDSNFLREPRLRTQITQAFLQDLVEYLGNRTIFFLLDDIGASAQGQAYLDSDTRRWLIREFVIPLCKNKLLTARFVITQRDELETDLQTDLDPFTESHPLTGFAGDQKTLYELYRTYLVEKQKIPAEQISDMLLYLFHQQVQGKPAMMFKWARDMKKNLGLRG